MFVQLENKKSGIDILHFLIHDFDHHQQKYVLPCNNCEFKFVYAIKEQKLTARHSFDAAATYQDSSETPTKDVNDVDDD